MKLLVLLALAAAAAAYYEPTDLSCHCRGEGDPLIYTYDHQLVVVQLEQKSLVSRYQNPEDKCQFQLRMVTKFDYFGEDGPLFIDWMGLSFDLHKNRQKFDKSLITGQALSHVGWRGRGIKATIRRDLPFYYDSEMTDISIAALNDTIEGGIAVRSESCGYAFNFYPLGRDTRFDFYIDQSFAYQSVPLVGLCGNCNANKTDDLFTCPSNDGSPPHPVVAAKKMLAIVQSCREGSHQGFNFMGARRISHIEETESAQAIMKKLAAQGKKTQKTNTNET